MGGGGGDGSGIGCFQIVLNKELISNLHSMTIREWGRGGGVKFPCPKSVY